MNTTLPTARRSADLSAQPADSRRPKVSVCIPAFQAERHLQATIDSVLAQDYADIEVVIVDNNSSDGTRDILRRLSDSRVRLIRNATTLPIADNFNFAIRQSRGQFVKLVCADDILQPGCIAAQASILANHPDVALVSARTDFIDDAGQLIRRARGLRGVVGQHSVEHVVGQIIRSGSNPIGPPVAAMFRRDVFDRCCGFRGEMPFLMEMELWVRLLLDGEFFGLPRTLISFRIGSSSMTALTSASSQLGQQLKFSRRLVEDLRWKVSAADRVIGRVNCLQMQVRRTLLLLISTMRDRRRRRRDGLVAAARHPALAAPGLGCTRIGVTSLATNMCGAESTTDVVTSDTVPAGSLSIVICSYTTRRWSDLRRAIDSVLDQEGPTTDVIVVIDHCDDLYLLACHRYRAIRRVTVCWNTFDPGLSGARNSGVAAARGDVIAFIDDDAEAESGWVCALMSHFIRDDVACVGGYATPVWPEGRPVWMPEEFDWVVGCSYVGQPTEVAPVRNPLGCNMSLRRSVFSTVGGFRSELGRVGTTPVGGEETELCIRIRAHEPSKQVLFDPEIRVRHHISADRATLGYFTQRCYHEGISKAVLTELTEGKALSTERAYVFQVLPRAVLREVSSMSRDGFTRAGMIILGLALTTSGYLRATLSRPFRARLTP